MAELLVILMHTYKDVISQLHDSALKSTFFVFDFPPHLQYNDEPQHRKIHPCIKKQEGGLATRLDMMRIFVDGLHFLLCLYLLL